MDYALHFVMNREELVKISKSFEISTTHFLTACWGIPYLLRYFFLMCLLHTLEVTGSNPVSSTISFR